MRRILRTAGLIAVSAVGGLVLGWLSEDDGWTRFVGVLAILAAVCTYVVLESRHER